MMRLQVLRVPLGLWLTAIVMGVFAGAAIVVPTDYLLAGGAVFAGTITLVWVRSRTELILAIYWLTYVLLSSMLRGFGIDGVFYPFYAAFLVSAVVGLARDGLQLDVRVAWTYATLLLVVVIALVGYEGPLSAGAMEQLILYAFGALVMLQIRSERGIRPIQVAAVLASAIVSVWVIANAAQAEFGYRGGVGVDQNLLSFFIGLGLLTVLTGWLHRRREPGSIVSTIAGLTLLVAMAYSVLLLASRGVTIGLAVTVAVVFVHEALRNRRSVRWFVVVAIALLIGLLLPGGQGVLERFEDPGTATGGGRTMIWSLVGEAYLDSAPSELALGHGFRSSRALVEGYFTGIGSTHNAYLQFLFDFGIVGLASFVTLHLLVWVRAWRASGRDSAWLLSIATFLMTANMFITTPDIFLYWAALGVTLAVAGRLPREQSGAALEAVA